MLRFLVFKSLWRTLLWKTVSFGTVFVNARPSVPHKQSVRSSLQFSFTGNNYNIISEMFPHIAKAVQKDNVISGYHTLEILGGMYSHSVKVCTGSVSV